ncbi:hypothetical protein HPB47_014067, partial [Ixodes persulcatus]
MKILEGVKRQPGVENGHREKAILKDGGKIEKAYNSGAFAPGRKRMRQADHKGLEKALFLRFKRARSSNLPVIWPILEEK